ncbi:MAG: diadenylate cyclase CdaA [Lachnospiraceae bacterium]|nr:diadenylate cyclase CdaA [Lachnospiraceae bacterium]
MRNTLSSISDFFNYYFSFNIPNIHAIDVIEIIIIAFFFYQILVWFKNTRAWMLFRGVMIIIAFFIVAAALQMNTILWLGEKLLNVALIMVVVVFQPELRKALENLGRKNLFAFLSGLGFAKGIAKRFEDKTLNDLVMACYEMGAVKTGALIVVENEMRLDEYERTGIALDSILSRQLLINIFEKNTPLHDGAVIVRGDRVVSATCYLPLSENMSLSKELGTRHRAAIGMSEVCDALIIVVSEETGQVSIAEHGKLRRGISGEELLEALRELQKPEEEENVSTKPHIVGRRAKHETENKN